MSEVNDPIIQLIEEYLSGVMEDVRREELTAWLDKKEENRLFFERLIQDGTWEQRWRQWEKIDTEAAIRRFDRCTRLDHGKRAYKRWVAAVAVAALLLLAVGFSLRQLMNRTEVAPVLVENILPGSDKAILILANGEKMKLENSDSLQVDLGAGNQLVNKDNQLVYQGEETGELQYNELQIPRGGEYQVKLADGTIVRLNSGSSLRYPVAFGKEKREVVLKGEAYFQVAKGKAPFYVQIGGLTVRVYGTVFNINSHYCDRIQTALVEGKVSILLGGKEFMMNPSQLADFDVSSATLDIRDADLTPCLAWTKGLFIFNNQTLGQIMSTLSLWYDMEVFFQNPVLEQLHFTGCVRRYEAIDNILKALSESVGVKINKQGKTLTVSY